MQTVDLVLQDVARLLEAVADSASDELHINNNSTYSIKHCIKAITDLTAVYVHQQPVVNTSIYSARHQKLPNALNMPLPHEQERL